MDVLIEVIGSHNAALLNNVSDGVFDHVIREEYLERFLENPNNVLLVALVDHSVVGMATGITYTHPDKPLQLFVNEVGVSDPYRRKGVGKKLLDGILSEGKARGCTEAWLATEENNLAARALYAAASGHEDSEKAVVYTWKFCNESGVV